MLWQSRVNQNERGSWIHQVLMLQDLERADVHLQNYYIKKALDGRRYVGESLGRGLSNLRQEYRLRLILTCNSIVEIAVNDMGVKKVHKMLSLLSNKLELAISILYCHIVQSNFCQLKGLIKLDSLQLDLIIFLTHRFWHTGLSSNWWHCNCIYLVNDKFFRSCMPQPSKSLFPFIFFQLVPPLLIDVYLCFLFIYLFIMICSCIDLWKHILLFRSLLLFSLCWDLISNLFPFLGPWYPYNFCWVLTYTS